MTGMDWRLVWVGDLAVLEDVVRLGWVGHLVGLGRRLG